MSEAHIVKSCKKKAQSVSNPCQWDYDDVYVDPTGATGVPTIPKSPGTYRNFTMPADPVPAPPVLNFAAFNNQWQTAQPGPQIPCDAGTYPPLDNNAALDVSLPGVTNLTPGTGYSCKTLDGQGGEITWDPTANPPTLTIKGTVFIDGSVEIDGPVPQDEPILYQGQGIIYVSGTFGLKSTTLCAVVDDNNADGSPCNLAAWDPNLTALIVVAMSRGADLPVSKRSASDNNSVEVVSSSFQGALFGVYDVSGTTASVIQGPVISTDASIILRNTAGASFPDVYFALSDTPGYPPTPTLLLAPREFGGGG